MADNHPASAEITAAHQIGIFQGYGDGTFRPDGKLTENQAELVIRRMLDWSGTDDGNFEISRADAAVLAMTGLCGLDPARIPACAAAVGPSEADLQDAYDRGWDAALDDIKPDDNPPPPNNENPDLPPRPSVVMGAGDHATAPYGAVVVGGCGRPVAGTHIQWKGYPETPTDVRAAPGAPTLRDTDLRVMVGRINPRGRIETLGRIESMHRFIGTETVLFLTQDDPDPGHDNQTAWTFRCGSYEEVVVFGDRLPPQRFPVLEGLEGWPYGGS